MIAPRRIASGSVNVPSYNARPIMQPAIGTAASRATSSTVVTPPEATTGHSTAALHLRHRRHVRPGHHSVGGDVGIDQRRDRLAGKPVGQFDRRHVAGRSASPRWPRGRRARRFPAPTGLGNSRHIRRNQSGSRRAKVPITSRSNPNASNSRMSSSLRMPPPSSHGTPVAWTIAATSERLDRPAFAGPVEIDQVETFRPQIDPMPGHGGRIFGEDGFLLVIALPKADAFPPSQVDRRPDFHAIAAPVQCSGATAKQAI